MAMWHYMVGEQQNGPVEKGQLLSMLKAGQLGWHSYVWSEGMESWQIASDVWQLKTAAGMPPVQPCQYQGGDHSGSSLEPHRGTLILVLGILGITNVCFICGIVAWIMGSGDLKKIDGGLMDPAGRSETRIGMILGMISTILAIVGLVLACCYLGVGFSAVAGI